MQSADDESRATDESADQLVHLPWESIDPDEDALEGAIPSLEDHAAPPTSPGTSAEAGWGPESAEIDSRTAPTPTLPLSTRGGGKSGALIEFQPLPVLAVRARQSPAAVPTPVVSGGWTIPILCAGIGLIACCLIIPQVDVNRRAAYKKLSLERDLASIKQQVAVNNEFLKRVGDDPTLAERLAQRQMNIVKEGSRVWRDPLTSTGGADAMSPFQIVDVPPPAPLPPYRPAGGTFVAACLAPRSQLYLTGVGLMLLAAGLVLGGVARE